MGFSTAMAGGIMLFAMLSMMMTMPSLLSNNQEFDQAYMQKSSTLSHIQKTSLNIDSISATSASNIVDVYLKNSGSTKLYNFEKFLILADYDADISGTSSRIIHSLDYVDSCIPTSGNWCISQIDDDIADPGLLNPDETLHMQVALSYPVNTGGDLILVVSSDKGITTTKSQVIS